MSTLKISLKLIIGVLIVILSLQLPAYAKPVKFPSRINNVDFPTDLTFAPNGDLYFTEKTGALKVFKKGGRRPKNVVKIPLPKLAGYNETGLLGIALSPDFQKDKLIYLYHTYKKDGALFNQVIRINVNKPGEKPAVIIDNIPGERVHDGGKLQFGPDGKLYIATGESGKRPLAQDKNSLGGKVLRINPDGSIPPDNPFNNAVWSYGHRNIFGMAFDNRGRLFVTENGPGYDDEVNEVIKGANYGWPIETGKGSGHFERPLITYREVNAPTGMIFYTGNKYRKLKNHLILGDWNDGAVHVINIKNGKATDKVIKKLGSRNGITSLAQARNGNIYLATDDSIFRLTNPSQ